MKWTIGNKPVITEVDKTAFSMPNTAWRCLSKRKPTDTEMKDAHLAWIGAKAIQSNSFAFVRDAVLLAQCGGQTNREDSAKFAGERATEFAVSLKGSPPPPIPLFSIELNIDMLGAMGVVSGSPPHPQTPDDRQPETR